jgi:CheY-like chemotaxis protein
LIKLGTFRPDVLILDVLMPEMDGLEVCRVIKKEPKLATMDVIIISGHLKNPRFRDLKRLGFTNMFAKPLKTGPFREAVRTILERRHANGIHPPKAGTDSDRG